ncbi:GGDEF domain-containing protein [Cohnella endophytica]|uniref:GGDEF domain-containing protein n=1 Tax=Cohnella endophytica TaxID=2419778 RepID=A0A494XUD9_9BACL|nr:diguanylate cyclase [Cohnella endophytica]RKP54190.1 GGDEF domain-containing protein [Cohnella endophytica]
MQLHRGFKLRSIVNALVLITVVATLTITSFISYRSEKQSLTRMTFQLNQVYAEKISDTVNHLFEGMKTSLAVTGQFLSTDLERPDLHEQLVLFQRSHSEFNAVFIFDKNGLLVDASNMDPNKKGSKVNSIGVVQALHEQRPIVSEPYVSSAINKLIVMVSEPLRDETGNYIGFIGGSIRLHETNIFQTLLGSAPNQEGGSYAYVVSSSSHLLYHPDDSRIGEEVKGNEAIIEVLQGRNGSKRIINSKGVDMLASYAYIKSASWGIVAQTPTEIVLSASRKLVVKLVLYMLPALLVFMALIYWAIGMLSSPLSKLATFASQLSPKNSAGDEMPRIHRLNYEANELHKAIGRATRHFRSQLDNLYLEAQTDPLTGLHNRRTMDRFLKSWIAEGTPFSLIVMDLDHFKRVNDTFGHDKGDEVLKFLSGMMLRQLSNNRICCRFGGEEFVVLVPNEDIGAALADAERICKLMSETKSPTGDIVTVSAGVALFPNASDNAEGLFRAADQALYLAKRNGRNRVEKISTPVAAEQVL